MIGILGGSKRMTMGDVCLSASPRGSPRMCEEQVYFQQIGRSPLLTAAEEKTLALAIMNDHCSLARDRMVRSNLRLVVAIAHCYRGRGLSLHDLIEEGNLGLLRAVDKYDPTRGPRFSSYASWWIKQAIRGALVNNVQPIHVPQYMPGLIFKWKRASRKLELALGRPPSLLELSDEMNLPLRTIRGIKDAIHARRTLPQGPADKNGEALDLGVLRADDQTAAPEAKVCQDDQIQSVRRLLETIDRRAARMLRLRFGLEGLQSFSLEQVGAEFGVSRERVRQITNEALCELKVRARTREPGRFSREPGHANHDETRSRFARSEA